MASTTDGPSSSARLGRLLKRGFITGLILIAPLAVTAFVVRLIYGWLLGSIRPFLRVAPADAAWADPLAVLVLIALITLLGIVVLHGFGRHIVERFHGLMEELPGIGPVYKSVRQATTALTGDDDSFDRVVLVRLPDSAFHTVGFVTAETGPNLRERVDEDESETYVNVFLPMAPNPMGGFLLVVPESDVVDTDLTVSEGIQLLMTTGIGGDEAEGGPAPASA